MPEDKPKLSFEAESSPPQFTPEQLATPPSCPPLVISEAEQKAEEDRKRKTEDERKRREAETAKAEPAKTTPRR